MKTAVGLSVFKKTLMAILCVFLLAFALVSSCSPILHGTAGNGSVQVRIKIPGSAKDFSDSGGQRFIHPDSKYIVVSISGDGMETASASATVVTIETSYVLKILEVPAGPKRTVTVSLYDAVGDGKLLLAEGSTILQVVADQVNTAAVTAIPKSVIELPLETPAAIAAGSGGKTFVYSVTIPAACTFSVALSDASLTPSVYNADGIGLASASTGTLRYAATEAGVFFVVLTVPPAFDGEATLTVSQLASSKEITAFGFASPVAAGVISGLDIAVTVPYGTSVTALVPTIVVTGVSVSPASGAAQDFSNPVAYTVTAADGSTQAYTVTVSIASSVSYPVSITPVFGSSAYKSLVFSPSAVSVNAGDTIAITTSNAELMALAGWKWYVDGVQTAGAVSASYIFDGSLYTSGTSYIISASVSGNGILYSGSLSISIGQPSVATYSVTYSNQYADGGDVPVDAGQYAPGASVTVLGNSASSPLTRTNSILIGWTDNPSGTGVVYGPGQVAGYTINSDVVFYPKWYEDIVSPNVGTLKCVPAGSFRRDSDPLNVSTVSAPFRMGRHEITRTQFFNVMGGDPSDAGYSPNAAYPVQRTNWYHAIAFCNKLSIIEGLAPVYTVAGVNFSTVIYDDIPIADDADWNAAVANWFNDGYRLPTEMEWMWAAMGATSGFGYGAPIYLTGYGKPFAGSDSILADGTGGSRVIGDYGVYGDTVTGIGGSKLPNELGLFDMSGNVWEWCWDKWAAYPGGTLVSDAADGSGRGAAAGNPILRGGGFNSAASNLQLADRTSNLHYFQDPHFGFRVVRN